MTLIERIEAASGAEYALDCAIWDLLYPNERLARFDSLTAKGQPYHGRLGPADMDGYVRPFRAFTASVDAALTLVPDGWSLGLGDLRGYNPIVWRAHLRDHNNPSASTRAWVEGNAPTAALALCAAALRAMEASHDA